MRKYELTAIDLEAIESLRRRTNIYLFSVWTADPTNRNRDIREAGQGVANNRELQAILEWARSSRQADYRAMVEASELTLVSFEDVTLFMALARHGRPRPRLDPGFQPTFNELP